MSQCQPKTLLSPATRDDTSAEYVYSKDEELARLAKAEEANAKRAEAEAKAEGKGGEAEAQP